MTKDEISSLAVTDGVRKGHLTGVVVGSSPTTVLIQWDGYGAPSAYSKDTTDLRDITVTCKAPPSTIAGEVRRGYYTRP